MNWEDFKETKYAVKCTTGKENFFAKCATNEIYNFMGNKAKERTVFICRLCYNDQYSAGRYELLSIDEWQTRPNMLFGKTGINIINYE